MEKLHNYVLDTNVLIRNPGAIETFDTNNVYIPVTVIKELDGLKKGSGEVGFAAREASRNIETLMMETSPEEIENGILLKSGGKFFFLDGDRPGYGDEGILEVAKKVKQHHPERRTILVSKDTNVRIRARISGLNAEDYLHDKAQVDFDEMFSVEGTLSVPENIIAEMYNDVKDGNPKSIEIPKYLEGKVHPNQYLQLVSGSHSKRLNVKIKCGRIIPLELNIRSSIENIKARNIRQLHLLDACLDQDFIVVNGLGRAGTGKTLMAIVAGINHVNEGRYDRVTVFRPLVDAGSNEIGYLPGNVSDKIGPYFGAIKNLVDFVLQGPGTITLMEENSLDFVPPNFIRGDTLNNTYMLVDEAQNFTPAELKLIGTRMGQGSKMVTVGDPFQSDLRYNNDERDNALTKATGYIRGIKELEERNVCAYVVLKEVERSLGAKIWGKF